MHFTETTKYVDPTSYADAMSRPDAKHWKEAFDKEMNGLAQRKVFTVVERPIDRNPLGTTMVYKYKIDHVKITVTGKCRLCPLGDWQKEGINFLKYKTFSAVLNCRKNRILYSLAAANRGGICFRLTLLRHRPMASWTCPRERPRRRRSPPPTPSRCRRFAITANFTDFNLQEHIFPHP